MKVFTYLFSL